ncbi:hypothetical protein EMCRGX_G010918 [Ephydatia muelleri]
MMRILLQLQQQKYRQLKDKRRMHWQPLIIRFALSIKYSSTSAYLVLSKLFVLPSLRDCTHWIKYPCSGTNINAIQFLIKDITQEGFDPLGFKVAVLVDEMKINVNDDIRKSFLGYFEQWRNEVEMKKKERRETLLGLKITVFSQDPIEIYFSHQRHCGGSRDNPSVLEFCNNTATLIQQRSIYRDGKTMNVKAQESQRINVETLFPKRKKMHKITVSPIL